MAEELTPQQRLAVTDRGGDLLVSAAAGSGKTKVLVDRLLSYLMDPVNPANIDDFLIITYTKAAASELREKIANKLNEKIAEFPDNRHLHRQLQRLYLTTISTVHSFCSEVLRQYGYMLDLPGDFSVMDDRDALQLRMEAMEQVLEQAYSDKDGDLDFFAFVDSQGFHRNDQEIPQLVLRVSDQALCHLQPDAWMEQCLHMAKVENVTDASETPWGRFLIDDLHETAAYEIAGLQKLLDKMRGLDGFASTEVLLSDIVMQLQRLLNAKTWDEIIAARNIDYGKLSFGKEAKGSQLSEDVKKIKSLCKENMDDKLEVFVGSNEQVMADLCNSYRTVKGLIGLVRAFHRAYAKLKRRLRVLDYSDLEHFTLDLLYGKSRTGITSVAKELGNRYREIMVDEYQDSNAIQEAIFGVLTQSRHNLFMVGDVKQSIYQFRMADPDIFLSKYNRFGPAGKTPPGEGRRVLLSSNFRSGGGILDAANDVFSGCMTQKLCGMDYGEEEALKEGVPHIPLKEPEIQLLGLRTKDDSKAQEAKMVAARIREILDGNHYVRDGKELRPAREEDIVILLRSPGTQGAQYKQALEDAGIACDDDLAENLFDADEICVLRSILTVISNPRQDIPLIAALTSPVFGYTANDLAALREKSRSLSIYELLVQSEDEKAKHFFSVLTQLRNDAKVTTIAGLLERIYLRTNLDSIYGAMEDAPRRREHLEQFYGIAVDYDSRNSANLEQFLRDLEVMDQTGLNLPSVPKQNCVRIYSIHKSKGLEFPIVFLCGLSKRFNQQALNNKVLLDKDLGIGLCCADNETRLYYPTIAKSAVALKMRRDMLAEEMRILYVAMTRPRDRLIMTFSFWKTETFFGNLISRMAYNDPVLIHRSMSRLISLVLYCAVQRTEAGAFFAFGDRPEQTHIGKTIWDIQVLEGEEDVQQAASFSQDSQEEVSADVAAIRKVMDFRYPYMEATGTPSKQTATQLKERYKDAEVSENTHRKTFRKNWRKPSFVSAPASPVERGNAIHSVLQYVDFARCDSAESLAGEFERLISAGMLSREDAALVDPHQVIELFSSELGKRIAASRKVLREFKFSVLVGSESNSEDRILLQGVVDCALIDEDGITVIDFKSDHVTRDTVEERTLEYSHQVNAYAQALSQIFGLPVREKWLYYFAINHAVCLN